uniref:Uncharacterized protein n=1 Tax=Cacopsylla melanoneura TaxID=428564 RepID=A0A8D9ET29_9HEMI
MFGSGINGHSRIGHNAHRRGSHYYCSPSACSPPSVNTHETLCQESAANNAIQIHVNFKLPEPVIEYPCIVNDNIQTAQLLQSHLEGFFKLRIIRDVTGTEYGSVWTVLVSPQFC